MHLTHTAAIVTGGASGLGAATAAALAAGGAHVFALDLPAVFTPDAAGFTPEEQVTLSGFGWFTAEELGVLVVWPAELALLLVGVTNTQPIDFGEVEESTVPVALGHR